MKTRVIHLFLMSLLYLTLTACAQSGQGEATPAVPPTQPLPASQPTPTFAPPRLLGTPVTSQGQNFPPAQGTSTPFPTPSSQALQKQVELAKQDLASRLSVSTDQIVLTDAREITWPDSSLGCPQPGMAYTQVTVDGVSIQLQVKDLVYSYHGDGIQPPFLCERVGPIGPMEPPKNK